MRSSRNLWLGAAIVAVATSPAFAQTQNAQSAMVDVQFDSSAYIIEETITWTFNRGTHKEPGTAMDAYTNAATSGPTVTCSGSAANCDPTNQPGAPAPPAPDEIKLQQWAQAQRCTFFFGGDLGPTEYTQSATVNGLNGRGNWTFTWTYTIAPVTVTVAPHTAWTSEVTGGTVNVGYSGFVASESFSKQSARNKYSFTMIDSGQTRARNVTATLQISDGGTPPLWTNVGTPTDLNNVDTNLDAVNDGLAIVSAATDFSYFGNAGRFGQSAVFGALHAPLGKAANLVTNILTGAGSIELAAFTDNFAGNNNDLAAGAVHTGPFVSDFPGLTDAGTYRVVVAGTLKGNSSSADFGFSVASSQFVIGGCSLPQ